MAFKKGYVPWNKGMKGYTNGGSFKKVQKHPCVVVSNKKRVEENHPLWKGDNCGYVSLHRWVRKHLGNACKCELCNSTNARKYEWHNKSGEYLRNLSDWISLCRSCHYNMDYGERRVRTF